MSRSRNVVVASFALFAIVAGCNEGSAPPAAPITMPATPDAAADAASVTTGALDASPISKDAVAAMSDSGPDAAAIDTRPDASKDGSPDAASHAPASAVSH